MRKKSFNVVDKEIDYTITHRFFDKSYENSMVHSYLCCLFPRASRYSVLWNNYWNEFNYLGYTFITGYIQYDEYCLTTDALTRLLILEDFKLYCHHNWYNDK